MKNKTMKFTGITLLSMTLLTGCDMGSPVAPPKESSTPTPAKQAQNKELPDNKDTKSKATPKPTVEPTFEATDYNTINNINMSLMFEKNTHHAVHQVFPQEEYNIMMGAVTGLGFIDAMVTNPSFYQAREYGSDAEFFNNTEVRSNMTTELFGELQNDIKKNGRTTVVPSADLKGRVKYRLLSINLDGTPKSKYDTPIIFPEKSKSGKDILAVAGRRTIIFKSPEEDSVDMKQTIEYFVTLMPDAQGWKVSGAGYKTLSPNKLLDKEGKEVEI